MHNCESNRFWFSTKCPVYSREKPFCTVKNKKLGEKFLKSTRQFFNGKELVLEVVPGKGIVTEALLENTDCKIILFQPSDELIKKLQCKFKEKFDKNIVVSDLNLYKLVQYIHSPTDHHARLMELVDAHTESSSGLRIIGSLNSIDFLYKLKCCFTLQISIYEKYNPILLFFVNFEVFAAINKLGTIRTLWRLGLPFSLYFDIQRVITVPNTDFTSNKLRLPEKHFKGFQNFIKNFYLLSFIPKSSICSSDNFVVS